MAPWRELLHLAWLREQIEDRIRELAATAAELPAEPIVLPKSGSRLRAVAPGSYLFEGGPHVRGQ